METRARLALVISDAAGFARTFIKVLSENKIPVLLPNANSGTLERLKSEYDAIVTEAETTSSIDLRDLDPEGEIIFFTSGSTGEPKKVIKKLRHLLSEVETIEKFFGAVSRGPVFSTVAHQHIYGLLFSVLWPLFSGREIGSLPIIFPEQLGLIEEAQPDYILVSSPAFLSRLDPSLQLKNCKLVLSSGALLRNEIAQQAFGAFGLYPHEIFGSTETGGVAWRQQSPEDENGTWTLIDVVSANLNLESQLEVASPFFSEETIVMGDRGVLVSERSFLLLDRADRIVKIEGKRVSLIEIEDALLAGGLVQEARAVHERTFRDQISVAIVLSFRGQEDLIMVGEPELKKVLRFQLSAFFDAVLIPKKIRFVNSLPRNSESKIDSQAVLELMNG